VVLLDALVCGHQHRDRTLGASKDDFGMVVVEPAVPSDQEGVEAHEVLLFSDEVLSSLGETRVDASPPEVRQIEASSLVAVHEGIGILRLQSSEVVTSRENQEIGGKSVPAQVRHLPRAVRPGGGHRAI
jgi:hypothetical protein